ncbi:hypothetical protein BT63DRAFT_79607 [Microthyrium microscopicum]|uniref:Uncharacterized protein n=1 Tax=Microthyrium microscopicum TaxID=703497 RepID=A0A6A6TZS4_9PEZI|nr:hypothetical protein BT63DRAFT_79607 [Microthyrium microscopicum]
MKSAWFSAALAASLVAAGPTAPGAVEAVHKMTKRQTAVSGLVNSVVNSGGKVKAPEGAAPTRVEMEPRTKQVPGAKTVKLRYGPYKVPSMKVVNVFGEGGALWNFADNAAPKPCEDDCAIMGINAGLEYPNGTNANIDTGLWLHHMVLFNIGKGRKDATCGDALVSLPHMIVGSSATGSERLFSSGNERTQAILPNWNENKVGYMLKPTDKFALIVDLMNDNMVDAVVYLTITYDYVQGHPAGWDDMKPIWFDVAQCLTSEWPAPYAQGKYSIPAPIWTANIDGDIVGAAGHLHDGGQAVVLEVDGKVACRSDASYGTSPEFIGKPMHGGPAEHISKMSLCIGDSLPHKKMVKGQKWKLRAEYDYSKNKGDSHAEGKPANVMGIAIMYVRVPFKG